MGLDEIKLCPMNMLPKYIQLFEEQGNQEMVNILAFELATRIYVPFKGINFDDIVASFGYKEIQKKKEERHQKKLVKS